jgi:hypothetical protein
MKKIIVSKEMTVTGVPSRNGFGTGSDDKKINRAT